MQERQEFGHPADYFLILIVVMFLALMVAYMSETNEILEYKETHTKHGIRYTNLSS